MVRPSEDDRSSENPSRKTRRETLKVVGAAGIAGLAGCTGRDGDEGTPTSQDTPDQGTPVGTTRQASDIAGQEVHVLKGSTNEATVKLFDELGRKFKDETGAILNIEYSGLGTTRYQRLIQLMQAGDPPEIAFSQLSNAITLWQQGVLAPVTGVMERLVDKLDAPPDSTRFIKNGEEWMVPWSIGFADYWYRRDLNEQAGLGSGFVPDTWENLTTYAEAISSNTDMAGVFVPASGGKKVTRMYFLSFLRSNNAKITKYENGDWHIAFHQGEQRQKWAETLEYMKRIHEFSPEAGGATFTQLIQSIPRAQAASTWFPGTRPKGHVTEKEFARDVVNVGHTPEGRSKKGRTNVGPMVVPKNSENPEAGKRFLEFLMGTVESGVDLCWADAPVHCQPPFPGLKESNYFKERLQSLPDHWTDTVVNRHLNEASKHGSVSAFETDPPNPYMGALLTPNTLADMVHDVLINDLSPEDSIDKYASEMMDILSRAKQ